ncbi:hypothetical protein C2E31_21400 [Rhodopirellula baltica]|nr:hypothetical protein C2E31_21400 [Rhodopirellula baltica]
MASSAVKDVSPVKNSHRLDAAHARTAFSSPHIVPRQAQPDISGDSLGEKEQHLENAVRDSGPTELRQASVIVTDGVVTILGNVSSFYHKQVAQEAVRPLAIGMEIHNRLRVEA